AARRGRRCRPIPAVIGMARGRLSAERSAGRPEVSEFQADLLPRGVRAPVLVLFLRAARRERGDAAPELPRLRLPARRPRAQRARAPRTSRGADSRAD